MFPDMTSTRRDWLFRSAALGALPASSLFAVSDPYERSGSRLAPALAAYSFRNHFAFMRGSPNAKAEGEETIDMPEFIRFCAEHGGVAAELTSYFFPPELDTTYLADCRRIAHVNGVAIAGTAVGNNFSHPAGSPERAEQMAYVKEWIDHAVVMGAPHVRVFAGKHPEGVSAEEAERNASEALEEAGAYAGERGIHLGIENHDSIGTADHLLRIVRAVKSPWVGVNLDTGNFRAPDPYAEMEASAPFAVNVQLKTELRIGDGDREPADFDRIFGILREAGYAGYVVLEYEEDKNPFEHVPALLEKIGTLCEG